MFGPKAIRCFRTLWAFLFLFSGIAHSTVGVLQALPEEALCRSEAHPESRRIFSCPTRKEYLAETNYKRDLVPALFDGIIEEHGLVKRAIEIVVAATALNAQGKAILWEELTAHLQSRLGHPVSQSFRGLHEEQPVYIFQGTKRFEGGKAYLLVVSEGAGLHSGLVEPIESICEWLAQLELFKTLFAPEP